VALLIVVMAAVHALVAGHSLLSGDEAYYWLWSRRLQLSYYDHPGMMAYWMAATTALFGTSELAVRLPALVSTAAVTWLAFDATRIAFDDSRAGLTAALWLNATILFGAAGVIVTPDAPLLLFWTLCLWAMIRLLREGRAVYLYIAAAALGLGFDSKYTMVLLAPGVLAVFVLFPAARCWWRRPALYLAIALAALCTSPVVVWNYTHDWASFRKQWAHGFASPIADPLKGLLTFLGSQVGVVTPLILAFCLWAVVWALWAGWRRQRPEWFLLGASSAPVLAFFTHHSLDGPVQAHWSGPAYIAGCMAAAGGWSVIGGRRRRGWNALFTAAPLMGAVMVAVVYLQAATAVLPLPLRMDALSRLGGWDDLGTAVAAQVRAHPDAFVFVEKHELTGLLSYYLPDHPTVFLTGSGGAPRLPTYDGQDVAGLAGRDGLFVVKSGSKGVENSAEHFADFTLLGSIERRWGGRVADRYEIYLGRDYRSHLFGELAMDNEQQRGRP
jgi:4-amino-4-deoxy-L-arabinose transferase-like glycosyltransferase